MSDVVHSLILATRACKKKQQSCKIYFALLHQL